jgi:hypothetical protein
MIGVAVRTIHRGEHNIACHLRQSICLLLPRTGGSLGLKETSGAFLRVVVIVAFIITKQQCRKEDKSLYH